MSNGKYFSESGIALLELAIMIAFLVIMIAGVIDFSLALEDHAKMVEAARAGAGAAAQSHRQEWNAVENVAVESARQSLERSAENPADFTVHVQNLRLCATDGRKISALRVSIGRAVPPKLFFARLPFFDSLAGVTFVLQSGVVDPDIGSGPSC